MKTKKSFNKKLELKKATIADLKSKEMSFVKGGLTYTDPRACITEGDCSIGQSIAYTCPVKCPKCYEA
jgi:natural product precursor